MKPRVYFAAPLFSQAERAFNLRASELLASVFEVYLPQVQGGLFVEQVREGRSAAEARREVFESDLAAIQASDVIVVVLDGRSVDEGVSFELGFAHAIGKRCVGLQTDPRRLVPAGNNPMIDSALERIFGSLEELAAWGRARTPQV